MSVSLLTLLVQETKAAIYQRGLDICTSIGLPVTSWQAGDPVRSLLHLEAYTLEALEAMVVGYIKSGFLDYATGTWLKVLAEQVFGVTVPAATYATTTVVLTNSASGGLYPIIAGDLTFKNSVTGATYHNTTPTTVTNLSPSSTLSVTVVADLAGSAGSAGAGEIDTLVTARDGVTCTNATAATGIDEQDEEVTRVTCREKLDFLSPDGARGAYSYVAKNSDFGGTPAITRTRVYGDSTTGIVTVYLAGPSGGSSAADVALATTAIVTWATPLCITPVIAAATNVTVPVTYSLWLYKSCGKTVTEVRASVLAALQAMFATVPIGGDVVAPATTGKLYQSDVAATIIRAIPEGFRVTVSAPSGDTALTNGQVAVLGTVTGTVSLEDDPN